MRELQIFQRDSETGVITYGLGPVPKYVEGMARLIQIVIAKILENPGRDVMNTTGGSGLRLKIGQTNMTDETEVLADMALAISKIQQEIVDAQTQTEDPIEEKLQALQIVNGVADFDSASVTLIIRVINQAGETTSIIL